jgi:hypothetical protein
MNAMSVHDLWKKKKIVIVIKTDYYESLIDLMASETMIGSQL